MKFFIIINIFLMHFAIAVIKIEESNSKIESAIKDLLIKSSYDKIKISLFSNKFRLDRVLEHLNYDKSVLINVTNKADLLKYKLVIIVIDNINDSSIQLILTVVNNVDEFYIIMTYDSIQKIILKVMQTVWDTHRISNINFIIQKYNKVLLVTFYPFSSGNCEIIDKLFIINEFTEKNWKFDEFFPQKLKNFHRCPLKLGTQPSFPAAERVALSNDSYDFIGSDVEITKVLSTKFNYTNIFVHNIWWGSIFENGTGDGSIGKLVTKDVDYICGWHFMNLHKSKHLDNSPPYFFVPFVIVVPPGAQYTSMENLIRCFSLPLWIGFICACIVIAIIIGFLNCYKRNQNEKISYLFIIVMIFGGSGRIPSESTSKIVLIMFILFCLVMRTAYLTEMFNFLQSGTIKGVVGSLEEMEELKFSLHVPFFMELFIPLKEIKYDQKLIKVSETADVEKFINLDSNFKGGFIEPLDSVIRGYNKSSTPLNILSEPLLTAPVVIYLQKNSFLREIFSKTIQQMIEAGLIEYWINQKWTSKMKNYSDGGSEPKVLSLNQLSAAFIMCIVGSFASFAVFLIEKCYYHYVFISKKNPSFTHRSP